MQLKFDVVKEVGEGKYPDVLHFPKTDAQLFYVENGRIRGRFTENIDNGEWDNMVLKDIAELFPGTNITNFELTMLPGFGAVGGYLAGNTQKLVIYRRELINSGN